MPTPKRGARLGGSPAHQRLILANLATALFEHGRLTTTEARARMLRPYAERLITKAKKGDLHNRRIVLRVIRDKGVVHTLFEEIGPRFAERPGGYTRITKIGPRKGDNAPMAVIELVSEEYVAHPRATHKPSQATAAAQPTDAPDAATAAPPAPVDPAAVDESVADTATSAVPEAMEANEELGANAAVDTDEVPAEAPVEEAPAGAETPVEELADPSDTVAPGVEAEPEPSAEDRPNPA